MSATNIAATLTLGAALGAGWVKVFSSGKSQLLNFGTLFKAVNTRIKETTDATALHILKQQRESIQNLKTSLNEVGSAASGLGDIFKNTVFAVSGYIGGLTAATAAVSDWGDTLAKTAQRLGMFDAAGTENVEMLQRMQWAALQANIGNEEFTAALDKMNQVVGQAATQGGETAQAFARLGLSAKALSGMGADRHRESESFRRTKNYRGRARRAVLRAKMARTSRCVFSLRSWANDGRDSHQLNSRYCHAFRFIF